MGPGEVISLLIVVSIPSLLWWYMARRFFTLREKKLELDARNAAEKAAQYIARSTELEQRLAVVEQIVTDGGMQTAAQIEALRVPRLRGTEKN